MRGDSLNLAYVGRLQKPPSVRFIFPVKRLFGERIDLVRRTKSQNNSLTNKKERLWQ